MNAPDPAPSLDSLTALEEAAALALEDDGSDAVGSDPEGPDLTAQLAQVKVCLRLLDQVCAKTSSESAASAGLSTPLEALAFVKGKASTWEQSAANRPRIPGYEILGVLGRGGMGVVYLALQVSLRRLVALKMLRAGVDAEAPYLARFRAEAMAIARLQHPNIVQIYDVGEADGRPYFAMEYADGGSLDDYLDGRPLAPSAAGQLVAVLARAVHAAHQCGIVHRDLKPANILLAFSREPPATAEPALAGGSRLNEVIPKITDFGLAKRLDRGTIGTQTGVILGTPGYMAPEQAAGGAKQVGPAADVYALGAILYQLLTGRPPFDPAMPLEFVFLALQKEPGSPRRLQPQVPPDLETICLKCLRKEPDKRYPSAHALAEDLQRFLHGEPIRARPMGAWERAIRWARRRPAVTALLAILFVVIVAGFLTITSLWVRAEQARVEEAHQRAVAQAVNGFLHDLLGQANTENQPCSNEHAGRNPHITVRELLDRSATVVATKFRDQPEVEAAIRQTIGDTYWALGRYEQAQQQLEPALAWRRQHLGADHPDTLHSMHSLGRLYQDRGRYAEAEALDREALAGRRARLGPDHPDTLLSLNNLASLYKVRGRYAEAEPLYREAWEGRRRTLGADHPNTLISLANLAYLGQLCGQYAGAERLFQEVLEGCRRQLGPDHPLTLASINNLAGLYRDCGRHDEAERLYREALAGRRRQLGADHPRTIRTMKGLAKVYQDRGRSTEAESLLREALDGCRRRLAADHPLTLATLSQLAGLYRNQGRYTEAEALFQEELAGQRRRLGADHPHTLETLNGLAGLYQDQGRLAEAEPLLLQAVSGARRTLGVAHPRTQSYIRNLGRLHEQAGRAKRAEPLQKELAIAAK